MLFGREAVIEAVEREARAYLQSTASSAPQCNHRGADDADENETVESEDDDCSFSTYTSTSRYSSCPSRSPVLSPEEGESRIISADLDKSTPFMHENVIDDDDDRISVDDSNLESTAGEILMNCTRSGNLSPTFPPQELPRLSSMPAIALREPVMLQRGTPPRVQPEARGSLLRNS